MQELQQQREAELEDLQQQLAELTSQLERLEMNLKKFAAGIQQMAALQADKEQNNKEEDEAYKVKKQTIDLLPNADDNIAKLQVHLCEEGRYWELVFPEQGKALGCCWFVVDSDLCVAAV